MADESPANTILKRDIHKALNLIARNVSTRFIKVNQSLLASGLDIDTSHLFLDECEDGDHRKS